MSSHKSLVGLDLEDLTPRQLRQLLRGAAKYAIMRNDQDDDEKEEKDDEAAKENDDLVDLQEETKGKSKAPKVQKDDLPEGIEVEEDEEEEAPKIAKSSKKAAK